MIVISDEEGGPEPAVEAASADVDSTVSDGIDGGDDSTVSDGSEGPVDKETLLPVKEEGDDQSDAEGGESEDLGAAPEISAEADPEVPETEL